MRTSRAYYQLVSGIKPSMSETRVITPHIDRRWHSISRLPDLDEVNQARQLDEIHTALLVGLAYKRINWTPVNNGKRVYRYAAPKQPGARLRRVERNPVRPVL